MLPSIPPGSLVQVEPAPVEGLRPGEVVMSGAWERLVVHRIERVLIQGDGSHKFVLRGDNLPRCDLPVAASAILGRVRCVAAGAWGAVGLCPTIPFAGGMGPSEGPISNDNWLEAAWTTVVDLFREVRRASGAAP
jgi:hypothetical protein